MGVDTGYNSGISGVVAVAGSPQFGVEVYYWNDDSDVSSTDNTGQGDAYQSDSLALLESGKLLLKFSVRQALWPVPTNLRDASGTLVESFNITDQANKATRTQTIRITSFTVGYDRKNNGMWMGTMTAERLGVPVYAHWPGSQPAVTARTPGNKYLYADRSKTWDANQLIDEATQVFNVWGLSADTDLAEVGAIGTILATYTGSPLAPTAILKQHSAIAQRLSTGVVRISVPWRRRNSKDEILNPETKSDIDPRDLTSNFTSGIMFLTSAAPSNPSPPSGFRLAGVETVKITDQQSNRVYDFRKKDSKDELLEPNQETRVDPKGLQSTATNADLDATPTIQAGYKLRNTRTVNVTPDHVLKVVEGGLRDTNDDETMPRTVTVIDPYGIESYQTSAQVLSGTIPGASLLTSSSTEFTQLVPGKYVSVKKLEPLNSVAKLEYPATHSHRSGQGNTDDQGVVLVSPSTDSVDSVADSELAVYQGFSNFESLDLVLLNNQKKFLKAHFNDPGTLVEFQGGGDRIRYLPVVSSNGTPSGSPQVYVDDIQVVSGSQKWVHVSPVYARSFPVLYFSVTRFFNQAAPIPIHAAQIGTTNAASFLGFAAKTVMYMEPGGKANVGLTGNIPMEVTYRFLFDPQGFWDVYGLMETYFLTTASVSLGLNNASLLSPKISAVQAATSDFSTF